MNPASEAKPIDLDALEVETVPDYYHSPSEKFLVRNQAGRWLPHSMGFYRRILASRGIKTKPAQGEAMAEADHQILDVLNSFDVSGFGPLCGRNAGFIEEGGSRYLVTENMDLIEPKKGTCPTIHAVVTGLFFTSETEEVGTAQMHVFFGWLKSSAEALRAGRRQQQQALAICGEADCGKIAREHNEMSRQSRESGRSSSSMDTSGYSLQRAIRGAASGHLDGFELECSQEIAHRSGVSPNGFFVPTAALSAEYRGMSVGMDGGTKGGKTVQTDVSDDILMALRPFSQIINAGATLFSGLSHSLSFPTQLAASTASWVTETGELTQTDNVINQVGLSPRRVGAFTEVSKMLLTQSSPGIDRFIQQDLLQAIGTAIDQAAINGNGGLSPVGILNTVGIGDVEGGPNGAAPEWADLVALIGKVADANADFGSLAYLSNSKVLSKLRSTQRITATDSIMLLEGNSILDYPILGSNNVPSNLDKGTAIGVASAIIFGDFSQVLIGQFGQGIDLVVDGYSKATSGITRVVANSFVDVAVRRAASFAAMKDALTV